MIVRVYIFQENVENTLHCKNSSDLNIIVNYVDIWQKRQKIFIIVEKMPMLTEEYISNQITYMDLQRKSSP